LEPTETPVCVYNIIINKKYFKYLDIHLKFSRYLTFEKKKL